jgi:hypothetical protein
MRRVFDDDDDDGVMNPLAAEKKTRHVKITRNSRVQLIFTEYFTVEDMIEKLCESKKPFSGVFRSDAVLY